ncbi:MAG: CDGSH iron-sulfur domain-containing protein [Deltaproteobacteria bacterium]|nr:CDGSH iron-sulfur domain-containing protein [Deltaproteobacteria bacterium]MBT7203857.1 CDGSH iron-sulfur domain-containing protein [Deltaproteobacteria bacterium]
MIILENQVSSPTIAKTSPFAVELEQGKKYAWCSCGLSSKQPFCDGSHKQTTFSPKVFTAEESKTFYLCGCKRTGESPFCDGTHNSLD